MPKILGALTPVIRYMIMGHRSFEARLKMTPCLHGNPRTWNRPSRARQQYAYVTAFVLSLLVTASYARADDGEDNFNHRCALCHTQSGAGIPGSFPPLRSQVVAFAQTPPGRTYLVAVVTNGRNGGLSLDGASYAGFMPAQGLSDAGVAAVLNYVVGTIAGGGDQLAAFTAIEVAGIRSGLAAHNPESTSALRPPYP
jgi:mono/diheme cytochrome c family protein